MAPVRSKPVALATPKHLPWGSSDVVEIRPILKVYGVQKRIKRDGDILLLICLVLLGAALPIYKHPWVLGDDNEEKIRACLGAVQDSLTNAASSGDHSFF